MNITYSISFINKKILSLCLLSLSLSLMFRTVCRRVDVKKEKEKESIVLTITCSITLVNLSFSSLSLPSLSLLSQRLGLCHGNSRGADGPLFVCARNNSSSRVCSWSYYQGRGNSASRGGRYRTATMSTPTAVQPNQSRTAARSGPPI